MLDLGKDRQLRVAKAFLTDKDFPFVMPHKLPIWLVEVKDLAVPGADKAAKEPAVWPRLYLAFDAEGEQLIEAFTPPVRPWWRQPEQVPRQAARGFPHLDRATVPAADRCGADYPAALRCGD